MKKSIHLIFIICAICPVMGNAARLLVPQQYSSIQAAINAAALHDTVLVSPGTYYENINFRAKGIVLASHYILSHDTADIDSTTINGSQPTIPDSASCVIIAGKVPSAAMDSSAMIIGFRITGGTGTKWNDEHNPGNIYREGGGILVQYLSPRILHNHITFNTATDLSGGMASAGGGAIRCGDSDPLIQNNVIDNNQGRYGAGIVFNFCGGVIRNNLIAHNTGGQDFGGSGIWIYGVNAQSSPRIITNNTVIYNYAGGPGGGIRAWSTSMTVTNNILWGNTASNGPQIFSGQSTSTVWYNDVQGGYTGEGNINLNPDFDATNYYLSQSSPCIDKGDSSSVYNDLDDTANPGNAKFPSKGTLRNDMGAYGGPFCTLLSSLNTIWTGSGKETNLGPSPDIRIIPNPVRDQAIIAMNISSDEKLVTELVDMNGRNILLLAETDHPRGEFTIRFSKGKLAAGNYRVIVKSDRHLLGERSLIIN